MKTSIEVEYWVIDEDGKLTAPDSLIDVSGQVDEEFVEPLFELKTTPCDSIDALRTTFVEQLTDVLARARSLDKRLVPLGTPINCGEIDCRPGERSRIQRAVVGENFDYAKHCAGTHVHVEKRNVTDQLNTLIAIDPALALVNSSPYFQGERIATGARAYCYRKRGYAEYPKHGQLWEYVETVGEWHRRLEHRFEEFKADAVGEGIDGDAVDSHFSPDDVVWTPVRLRDEMPTVEWRSPDSALPSQILRLATELEAMMERVHHTNVRVAETVGEHRNAATDDVVLPPFSRVCDLAEAAMHEGLDSPDVATYLERMGFSVGDYHPIAAQIDGRQYVTSADARELRLEYADRLEEDVDELAAALGV